MTRKTKPIRSDIAWSTPDRIEVRGKSLPDEILGHLNLVGCNAAMPPLATIGYTDRYPPISGQRQIAARGIPS